MTDVFLNSRDLFHPQVIQVPCMQTTSLLKVGFHFRLYFWFFSFQCVDLTFILCFMLITATSGEKLQKLHCTCVHADLSTPVTVFVHLDDRGQVWQAAELQL